MNNNSFKDLVFRFFKSGNPAMFYIGVNVVIFVLGAILSLFISLGVGGSFMDAVVRPFFAFPAEISQWPYRFYTIITYAFFHQDVFHILFNCLWLYWMGNLFLQFLKPKQFQVVYWGGAILGALAFAIIYNISNQLNAGGATLIGASAAVMAVFAAITTLLPNYSIRLMLFGDVKLKYILLVYILIDVLSINPGAANIGGNLAHLGGALFGFVYIKLLQNGTDLSKFLEKKPKLKVVKNQAPVKKATVTNQEEIDLILDKISKTGYENLTAQEKRTLFDASKN